MAPVGVKGLSFPYCQLKGLSVCVSETLTVNISETK